MPESRQAHPDSQIGPQPRYIPGEVGQITNPLDQPSTPRWRRAAIPSARGIWALGAAALVLSLARDAVRVKTVPLLPPPSPVIDVRVEPRARTQRSGDPIRLAALGDSSIAGIGADDLHGCLAVQVARRVAEDTGRAVEVRGYGVSGARTADVLDQVAVMDAEPPPHVVLVVVGANDIAHATPPWRYAEDVRRLYRAVRARCDVPVVASSLPEMRAIRLVGRPLRDVAVANGRLLGVLQRRAVAAVPGVRWVDARREAGPGFLGDPRTMSADGYHPSAAGYALLAASLGPALTQAVGGRAPTTHGSGSTGAHGAVTA